MGASARRLFRWATAGVSSVSLAVWLSAARRQWNAIGEREREKEGGREGEGEGERERESI